MINDKSDTIENLSQFIEWTRSLNESEGSPSFPLFNIFFRGHASKEWRLLAGLFREENKNVNEHKCFNIASNRCWAVVSSFSNLEKLIYFQHFGLLTRLLDVTSNPLVALFFACQECKENGACKDGQVRYGTCDRYDLKMAQLIVDVIANYDLDEIHPSDKWLQRLADSYHWKSSEILGEQLSIPYYIEAPYNSNRITSQRGALLMPPLLQKNDFGYIIARNYDFDKADENNMMFGQKNVIIRHEQKGQILNELRRVGIDDYSIFSDTPHLMSSINKEMKDAR